METQGDNNDGSGRLPLSMSNEEEMREELIRCHAENEKLRQHIQHIQQQYLLLDQQNKEMEEVISQKNKEMEERLKLCTCCQIMNPLQQTRDGSPLLEPNAGQHQQNPPVVATPQEAQQSLAIEHVVVELSEPEIDTRSLIPGFRLDDYENIIKSRRHQKKSKKGKRKKRKKLPPNPKPKKLEDPFEPDKYLKPSPHVVEASGEVKVGKDISVRPWGIHLMGQAEIDRSEAEKRRKKEVLASNVEPERKMVGW